MQNNLVTFDQLKCPKPQLDCILTDLFSTYGSIKSYTNAGKPTKGYAGQIIFVTDVNASDGTLGTLKTWQPSTNSWKKLNIS